MDRFAVADRIGVTGCPVVARMKESVNYVLSARKVYHNVRGQHRSNSGSFAESEKAAEVSPIFMIDRAGSDNDDGNIVSVSLKLAFGFDLGLSVVGRPPPGLGAYRTAMDESFNAIADGGFNHVDCSLNVHPMKGLGRCIVIHECGKMIDDLNVTHGGIQTLWRCDID